MSRYISSHFGAIRSKNVRRSQKSQKITKNPCFKGLRSFKVTDVESKKKPVTSACYVKQHVCAYLQPCSHCTR